MQGSATCGKSATGGTRRQHQGSIGSVLIGNRVFCVVFLFCMINKLLRPRLSAPHVSVVVAELQLNCRVICHQLGCR